MALAVHFVGGKRAGEVLQFGDEIERIAFGRDSEKCQVVFPPDETHVGREHCALRRELGRYRLVLNKDDVVLLDGKPARDGQELGAEAEMRLGRHGPMLVVRTALNEKLLPTDDREHQRGQATILRQTERAAARGWILAGAALLLVGLVGTAAYQGWHQLDHWRLTVEPRLTELTAGQQALLAQIGEKLAQQTETAAADEVRLREALAKAADSVYLVLNRDPNGDLMPEATAWVVDQKKGILATNGHVADIFNEIADGQPDHQLVVRSPANPPRDFVIKSVDIHPGYSASNELWQKFQPVRRTAETSSEAIDQPGPFCDVALMYVEDAEGLAAALPLAEGDTLKQLGPGDAVGLAGYPTEGLVLGGVNVAEPTPTIHLAYLSAVTNYFGASRVDDSERLLIQHAIPTAGGASGSPIVNAEGRVVAVHSGGNSIGQTESGARIGSTALINFGQRADLLRELLEGRAADVQTARGEKWAQELAQYFRPAADVEHDIEKALIDQREAKFAVMLEQWRTQLATDFVVAGVTELTKTDDALSESIAQDGTYQKSLSLDVRKVGKLLVAAVGHKVPDLNLDLYQSLKGKRGRAISSQKYQADWLPYCFIDVNSASRFEALASGTQPSAEFTWHAWLAEVSPMTPDTHRQALATAWVNSHFLWQALDYRPKVVAHETRKLSSVQGGKLHGAVVPLKLAEADEYFVVANAAAGQHITLVATSSPTQTLGQDTSDTAWPSCSFSLSQATEVQISVFGPADGIEIELHVYRATEQ